MGARQTGDAIYGREREDMRVAEEGFGRKGGKGWEEEREGR